MHPAPSIILFTVLSGFGFGALAFLGLGLNPATGMNAFILYAVAAGSGAVGLLFSFFHLGHPERALKAFQQVRSSWLSREGWLAAITLILAAFNGGNIVFLGNTNDTLGQIMSAFAVLTILATSMIYTQLKTVPRWNDFTTPVIFLMSGLIGGLFLIPGISLTWYLLAFAIAQLLVWMRGATRFAARAHSIGTATGLGNRGRVRAFEPPHTGTNYLMNEMIHVVGRRHPRTLQAIGLVLATLAPAVLLAIVDTPEIRAFALLSHILGMMSIRWLFFAEAEHVVGLYYGKR